MLTSRGLLLGGPKTETASASASSSPSCRRRLSSDAAAMAPRRRAPHPPQRPSEAGRGGRGRQQQGRPRRWLCLDPRAGRSWGSNSAPTELAAAASMEMDGECPGPGLLGQLAPHCSLDTSVHATYYSVQAVKKKKALLIDRPSRTQRRHIGTFVRYRAVSCQIAPLKKKKKGCQIACQSAKIEFWV